MDNKAQADADLNRQLSDVSTRLQQNAVVIKLFPNIANIDQALTKDNLYDQFHNEYPYLSVSDKRSLINALNELAEFIILAEAQQKAKTGELAQQYGSYSYGDLRNFHTQVTFVRQDCLNIAAKQGLGFFAIIKAKIGTIFSTSDLPMWILTAIFAGLLAITAYATGISFALTALAAIIPIGFALIYTPKYPQTEEALYYAPEQIPTRTIRTQAFDRLPWYGKLAVIVFGLAAAAGLGFLVYEAIGIATGAISPSIFIGSSGIGTSAVAFIPLVAFIAAIIVTAVIIEKNWPEAAISLTKQSHIQPDVTPGTTSLPIFANMSHAVSSTPTASTSTASNSTAVIASSSNSATSSHSVVSNANSTPTNKREVSTIIAPAI